MDGTRRQIGRGRDLIASTSSHLCPYACLQSSAGAKWSQRTKYQPK